MYYSYQPWTKLWMFSIMIDHSKTLMVFSGPAFPVISVLRYSRGLGCGEKGLHPLTVCRGEYSSFLTSSQPGLGGCPPQIDVINTLKVVPCAMLTAFKQIPLAFRQDSARELFTASESGETVHWNTPLTSLACKSATMALTLTTCVGRVC